MNRSDVALLVVEIEKEAERDFPYVEKLSSISKNLLNEVIETLPKEE